MSTGLYRTSKSNYVPYFPDGRGRDRYIAYNNAGFFKDFQNSSNNKYIYRTGSFFGTKINTHLKSPSVKAPNFHYHANGNGRDKYILENGGGLFSEYKPLITYKLSDFLRKSDDDISPNKKIKAFLSKDEIKYKKILKEKEKNLIKRLYTNAKKRFLKKINVNIKSFLSCDKIRMDSKNETYNNNKNETRDNYISSYNDNGKIMEKTQQNGFFSSRYKLRKIKKFNNFLNFSQNSLTNINSKSKIVIDANANDKKEKLAKKIISYENSDNNTKNNFENNINKFKKDYLRKKFIINRNVNFYSDLTN
jgi:hypothetical protein